MAPDGLVSALMARQHDDGGWGYQRGAASWTEPTCLTLLALTGMAGADRVTARGRAWLHRTQRADGGWAPEPRVEQSTWVTSLSVLSLAPNGNSAAVIRGLEWLLEQSGRQGTKMDRFRDWLSGHAQTPAPCGWSWYPGTASWVIPTAMGILALEKAGGAAGLASTGGRVAQGREFLLARQCAGGGWNHGGTPVRSENSRPYPETTGIALLALHSTTGNQMNRAIELGSRLLYTPESSEGESWLRLGLAAHGQKVQPHRSTAATPATTVGLALHILTNQTRNPLLQKSPA